MIAPIMIACKERYAKLATISVNSFLKYHDVMLYVVVDSTAAKILSTIKHKNLCLVPLSDYRKDVQDTLKIHSFDTFNYDDDGDHDRAYSSLKPLIMERVISNLSPASKYVLSLDSDTLFSGEILQKVYKIIKRDKNVPDLYMVARDDPRMLTTGSFQPGSGFTMWKRGSKFISLFRSMYEKRFCKYKGGGSQDLINKILQIIPSKLIYDPLLHYVSPDLKNPDISDAEIEKIKPAYIHLHGKDSYQRLLKFRKILEKE